MKIRICSCPYQVRLFFENTDFIRQTGLCGFMVFGLQNCFQRSIRILTFFWIPRKTGQCHIWSFFPVEINQADYYELLRVPGIGYTSARRIIGARRTHSLEFADLKRIGVVLKRALYFITCNGRMMYNTRLEESYITRNLLDEENCRKHGNEAAFQQLSLFGDEMGSRRLYTENTKNHVDRKVGAI